MIGLIVFGIAAAGAVYVATRNSTTTPPIPPVPPVPPQKPFVKSPVAPISHFGAFTPSGFGPVLSPVAAKPSFGTLPVSPVAAQPSFGTLGLPALSPASYGQASDTEAVLSSVPKVIADNVRYATNLPPASATFVDTGYLAAISSPTYYPTLRPIATAYAQRVIDAGPSGAIATAYGSVPPIEVLLQTSPGDHPDLVNEIESYGQH